MFIGSLVPSTPSQVVNAAAAGSSQPVAIGIDVMTLARLPRIVHAWFSGLGPRRNRDLAMIDARRSA